MNTSFRRGYWHLVKVLVVLSLYAVHIAVVESVKQRERGSWGSLLPRHVVPLVINYLLHLNEQIETHRTYCTLYTIVYRTRYRKGTDKSKKLTHTRSESQSMSPSPPRKLPGVFLSNLAFSTLF